MIIGPNEDIGKLLGPLTPGDVTAIERFRRFLREIDKPKCTCDSKDTPHWHVRPNTWRYIKGEEVDPDGPWELE